MKYKHSQETIEILNDLENRIIQLIEVSEITYGNGFEKAKIEMQAFNAVLTLLDQVRDNGHVFRGSELYPDDVEPLVKTKSYKQPQKLL